MSLSLSASHLKGWFSTNILKIYGIAVQYNRPSLQRNRMCCGYDHVAQYGYWRRDVVFLLQGGCSSRAPKRVLQDGLLTILSLSNKVGKSYTPTQLGMNIMSLQVTPPSSFQFLMNVNSFVCFSPLQQDTNVRFKVLAASSMKMRGSV
jgi:hypothetical protein